MCQNLFPDFTKRHDILYILYLVFVSVLGVPVNRTHGICIPEHNCRGRGHAVWTLVSATCFQPLTVPLFGRRMYHVAGEGGTM